MYPGDQPPSFTSGGVKPFNQEQFNVDPELYGVHNDQTSQNQPPSQGSMGHGQGNSLINQLQDTVVYRGSTQPDPVVSVDSEKLPSFTALGHGQGLSHNHDGMSTREYSLTGQALSISDMVKPGFSNPSGGDGHYAGDSAPGLSDVAVRERSETGRSSSTDIDTSSDPLEFVGMSLVGKNFKKYYPNAYYKEKDEY